MNGRGLCLSRLPDPAVGVFMKKRLPVVLGVLLALSPFASAADKQKNFSLVVDPPDANIRVLSGSDLKEQQYRSPASIAAGVAKDPEIARKAVVEITHDRYKPAIIALRSIRDGETLKVKLEKIVRDRLKFRFAGTRQSDQLLIKDDTLSMGLTVDERQLQLSLTNLSPQTIRVVWERAAFTDISRQSHRLMHAGIAFEDRMKPFPVQAVMSGTTLHEALIPAGYISRSWPSKVYEVRPLFKLKAGAAAELTGKAFEVVIPVEAGGEITPYTFKIEIAVVRE